MSELHLANIECAMLKISTDEHRRLNYDDCTQIIESLVSLSLSFSFFFFLSLSVFAIVYILVWSLLFTFFSYIFIFFFIFVAASNAIQRLIINFLILRSRLRFHAKVQLYCIFQCNHLFHSIRNRSQPRWYYHIRNNSIIIWMRHSFLAFDQYSCPLNVLPLICSLCL